MTGPARIENPPEVAPRWWDLRGDPPTFEPTPGTLLPCGCHLRRPDYEAVLCPEHLAEVNQPDQGLCPACRHPWVHHTGGSCTSCGILRVGPCHAVPPEPVRP